MNIIDIYYDAQDNQNKGWAYRIEGGESGSINELASDAIDRICENMEAKTGDHAAIIDAVSAVTGDQIWLGLEDMPRYIDVASLVGLDGK